MNILRSDVTLQQSKTIRICSILCSEDVFVMVIIMSIELTGKYKPQQIRKQPTINIYVSP